MMGLYLSYGKTMMVEGVVAHVQRGEGFSCEVRYPITELVVTSRDEAARIAIQGMTNVKRFIAAVTVRWEV